MIDMGTCLVQKWTSKLLIIYYLEDLRNLKGKRLYVHHMHLVK